MGANEKLRVSADLGRDVTINMGLMIEVLLVPHDGIRVGLRVGSALERDIVMTVGNTMGISLGLTNGIGYEPGEGT